MPVAGQHIPANGDHQSERQFGGRFGEKVGDDRDRNPPFRTGGDVDVVMALQRAGKS